MNLTYKIIIKKKNSLTNAAAQWGCVRAYGWLIEWNRHANRALAVAKILEWTKVIKRDFWSLTVKATLSFVFTDEHFKSELLWHQSAGAASSNCGYFPTSHGTQCLQLKPPKTFMCTPKMGENHIMQQQKQIVVTSKGHFQRKTFFPQTWRVSVSHHCFQQQNGKGEMTPY